MNHVLDNKNHCIFCLENMVLYITSYEVVRRRRITFKEISEYHLYTVYNGSYPLCIKIKGYTLRSECAAPAVILNRAMKGDNYSSVLVDNLMCSAARIKSFDIQAEPETEKMNCEIEIVCESEITEMLVE